MKLTQTDNQITTKTSGFGQMVLGLIFCVGGIALGIAVLAGVIQGAPVWLSVVGLILVVIGIFSIKAAQNQVITIVKGGETTITATRILGGQAQQESFPTANIVAVRLQTYLDTSGTNNATTAQEGFSFNNNNVNVSKRSDLSLLLNNNDSVQIASEEKGSTRLNGMNVGSLVRQAPSSNEGNQIATFLGVPLQASDTSDIIATAKTFVTGVQQALQQPTSAASPPPAGSVAPVTQQPEVPPTVPMAPSPAQPVSPLPSTVQTQASPQPPNGQNPPPAQG